MDIQDGVLRVGHASCRISTITRLQRWTFKGRPGSGNRDTYGRALRRLSICLVLPTLVLATLKLTGTADATAPYVAAVGAAFVLYSLLRIALVMSRPTWYTLIIESADSTVIALTTRSARELDTWSTAISDAINGVPAATCHFALHADNVVNSDVFNTTGGTTRKPAHNNG